MKKIFFTLLSALMLVSCNFIDDGIYIKDYSILVNVVDANTFKSDDGVVFNVVELACDRNYEKLTRVLIECDVLDTGNNDMESTKSCDIKLTSYHEIEIKPMVKLAEPGDVVLGNDPAEIEYVWFSGKYLNIQYRYTLVADSKTKHDVNLVIDYEKSDASNWYFVLKHEGYGETFSNEEVDASKIIIVSDIVSYDISWLKNESKSSVNANFSWVWYQSSDYGYLIRDVETQEVSQTVSY